MKISFLLLLCAALLFVQCSDDEKAIPNPRFRAETLSYGDVMYRILRYDTQGRISQVINGHIAEPGDSAEVTFNIIYAGEKIERIKSDENQSEFAYVYEDARITESREYVDGKLAFINSFTYDAANRVAVWSVKQPTDDGVTPVSREVFAYDDRGNATALEYETYDPVTKGHALVSTTKWLDYDGEKNSASLFVNFKHPYHQQFRNNPRTWRVENANGSVGETHYTYQYNAEGFVTRQVDVAGELEIIYQFVPY